MNSIFTAVILVSVIGAFCALILVIAAKFFSVKEDEKYKQIRECLPGANCGACGYTGCDGYAKALAEDADVKCNLCTPGADETARKISEILKVDFQDVVEKVAIIHCYGDCEHTSDKLEYVGIQSCVAAKMYYGGKRKCSFACLGFGDCVSVCPQGAICINKDIAHIDTRKCIGCGICVNVCPVHIIDIMPDVERVLITCSNTDKGAVARSQCTNGCIGCKKCEKICESGAIKVVDNLARIDYDKCTKCEKCAENCPSGCIVVSNFNGLHRFKK